jgi:hypothetical protein
MAWAGEFQIHGHNLLKTQTKNGHEAHSVVRRCVASNIGELPAGSRRILRLTLPLRSFLIANIKKRPSMAALFNPPAIVPDREHQTASIHGRTIQSPCDRP